MPINNRDKTIQKFYRNLESGTSNIARFYQDDPTVMGFNLFFYFSDTPDSAGSTLSPLFNEDSSRDSAINYLEAIGEPESADKLREFKERLRDLIQDYPHYLQTISGLETVMAAPNMNPHRMEEVLLTIETLESIDLKISTLINLYREAVYDYTYMRYRLPDNLQFFQMAILVTEIRNIRTFVGEVFDDNSPKFELIDNNMIIHRYQFGQCKFVFDEANPWMANIDNKGGEFAANAFSIKPGFLKESHNLKFKDLFNPSETENRRPDTVPNLPRRTYSSETNLPKADGSVDDFRGTINNRAQQLANITKDFFEREREFFRTKIDLNTLGNRAINSAFDVVQNRLLDFTLGNVFSNLNRFKNLDIYDSVEQFAKNQLFPDDNRDPGPTSRAKIELNADKSEPTRPDSLDGDIDQINFPEQDDLGRLFTIMRSESPDNLGDIIDEIRSEQANNLGQREQVPTSQLPDDLGNREFEYRNAIISDLGDVDVEKVPFNFAEAALGNIDGFLEAPFSSTLNTILAGSLGSITLR